MSQQEWNDFVDRDEWMRRMECWQSDRAFASDRTGPDLTRLLIGLVFYAAIIGLIVVACLIIVAVLP